MRTPCEWSIRLSIAVGVATLGFLIPASAQTTIFNCSSWATTGTCGVQDTYLHQNFGFVGNGPPSVSGTHILLQPVGSTHNTENINYAAAKVNVQAFTTTFTFLPNGWNLAFVLQNNARANSVAGPGAFFGAGGGCEGGFYQAFSGAPPNNIFVLNLDSNNSNTVIPDEFGGGAGFTYSNAQIYQTAQSPCIPNDGQPSWWPTDKISTSPVSLNSPVSTYNTCLQTVSGTCDTYSATITYNGSDVTLSLYDVTAGGSCPGASCFTHTWSNINIPSLVDGTTAYVGLATSSNNAATLPLYLNTWSYTVNGPTAAPSYSAWNAKSTYGNGTVSVASPVYSVAPGTYSGMQAVSITTSTSGGSPYICYALASSIPTLYPQVDNYGNCLNSTLYSGPVTISSTQTLYAMAGNVWSNPPSTLVAGTYTIGGSPTAATPTFSPAAGTYSSAQSVSISDATSGATIYYTTNGTTPTTSSTQYTGPITVSSTETLQAIAAATGDTNIGVASAVYTITAIGVGSPMTCLPLQSVPGEPGMLQTACTIVLTP
jgi:hypothetical protein